MLNRNSPNLIHGIDEREVDYPLKHPDFECLLETRLPVFISLIHSITENVKEDLMVESNIRLKS